MAGGKGKESPGTERPVVFATTHWTEVLEAGKENEAAALGIVALAVSAGTVTLHVPAQYATIQAAVNAAAPSGDEILIAPGVYNQQVYITQKKLALTGSSGTILQAWPA